MLNETKVQSFIQRGKDLNKSRDEINVAYKQAVNDWLFDTIEQTPVQEPQTFATGISSLEKGLEQPKEEWFISKVLKKHPVWQAFEAVKKAPSYLKWVWEEVIGWLSKPLEEEQILPRMAEQIKWNIEWYKASAEWLRKWEQGAFDTWMQMLLESWDVALTPLRELFMSTMDVLTPESTEEELKALVWKVADTKVWEKVWEAYQKISSEYEELKETDPGKARNQRATMKWLEFFADLWGISLLKQPAKQVWKEIIEQTAKQVVTPPVAPIVKPTIPS